MNRKLKLAIRDFVTLGLYFWSGPIESRNKFDRYKISFGLFLETEFDANGGFGYELPEGIDLSINGHDDWITTHAQNFFEYDEATQIPYLEYNGNEVEFNEEGDDEYTWEENAYTEYGQEPHEQCAEIIEDAFRDKLDKTFGGILPATKLWSGELARLLRETMKNEDGYGPKVEKDFFDSLCEYVLEEIIEANKKKVSH